MEDVVGDVVGELLKQYEGKGRVVIGLAGVPGSGKSTTAKMLAKAVDVRLGAGSGSAVSMDGWHYPKKSLDAFEDVEEAYRRRGSPFTFDTRALATTLRQLRAAADDVLVPTFDHAKGDPVPGGQVVPAACRFVFVEGNYVGLDPRVTSIEGRPGAVMGEGPVEDWLPAWLGPRERWDELEFDEVWYLDCLVPVALDRLQIRHQKAWGIDQAAAWQRIRGNDEPNAVLIVQFLSPSITRRIPSLPLRSPPSPSSPPSSQD